MRHADGVVLTLGCTLCCNILVFPDSPDASNYGGVIPRDSENSLKLLRYHYLLFLDDTNKVCHRCWRDDVGLAMR